MKTRNGFVSNSSSSSFIIKKKNLTEHQIWQIKNYHDEAVRIGIDKFGVLDDYWEVQETSDMIMARTGMDNFDFETFLNYIAVKSEDIDWEN